LTEKLNAVYVKGKRFYPLPRTGELVPSVSTFLKTIPAPALEKWKRAQVAEAAVEYKSSWENLPPEAAKELLLSDKLGSTKARDDGDRVHAIFEDLAVGRAPYIGEDFEEQGRRVIEIWERFNNEFDVKVLAVEPQLMNYNLLYAGSADLIVEINGVPGILDYKSGSGIFGSTAYQTKSYGMCDKMLDPNTGKEVDSIPVEAAWGFWVRPGGYALYPLAFDDEVATVVRAARALFDRVYEDWKFRGKPINPNPIRTKGSSW
jgi:hypothetical protein